MARLMLSRVGCPWRDLPAEFGCWNSIYQHSSGAMGSENQAIGKSVGGYTTKIHMAVDACGFPIEFDLTGGEVHGCKAAPRESGQNIHIRFT